MYYSISNDLRKMMDDATRQEPLLICKLKDGTILNITSEEILANSLVIDRYSMNGERLELGNVSAHQLTMSLANKDIYNGLDFNEAEISGVVYVGIIPVQIGTYYVTESNISYSAIKLTALDLLSTMDVVWNFSGVSFPATAVQIVQKIESDLGITVLYGGGIVNNSVTIDSAPTSQVSYRMALSWCAQILGYNQVFVDFLTSDKTLKMARYRLSDEPFLLTPDHRYGSSAKSQDALCTGIKYKSGSLDLLSGDEDYCIDISDNDLIGQSSNASTIIANLNTAWNGFAYRPYSASALTYPHLMPIDTVTFVDTKGDAYFSIVSHVRYSLNGRSEIKGVGISLADASAQINPLLSSVRRATESSLSSVDVYYALSSSTTTAPTTGWSTIAPTWTSGMYMWQKTVWSYGNGKSEESSPTCIAGAQGQKGADGTSVTILGSYDTVAELKAAHPTGSDGDAYMVGSDLYVWSSSLNDWQNVGQIKGDTGNGVSNIQEQYYKSTSASTPTGGSWQTNCPSWENGYYIWTRSEVTWTDGTVTHTTASLAGAINSANATASSASSMASTANTKANTAVSTANTANTNASNAVSTANSAQSTATTANNTANAVHNEVVQLKGNIYVQGTTTIDGSVIANGTVTAQQINGDGLDVSNGEMDNCTIKNNCIILGKLSGNEIASNTDGETTGQLIFNPYGYQLEAINGTNEMRLSVGFNSSFGKYAILGSSLGFPFLMMTGENADLEGHIITIATDGASGDKIELIALNGITLSANSVTINGVQPVKKRVWSNADVDSNLWGTYIDLHFVSNGQEFEGLSVDGNSWAEIAYLQPNGTWLTVCSGRDFEWIDNAYKTMYITYKPHNPTLNTIIEDYTT